MFSHTTIAQGWFISFTQSGLRTLWKSRGINAWSGVKTVKTMWGQNDAINIFRLWKITSSCFQKTWCVFQVPRQQPGGEMGKIICGSLSHPSTNSLSVKDLQIIPNCKQIACWLCLGVTARRQIIDDGVWAAWPPEQAEASKFKLLNYAVFSSSSLQCLTFTQFLRKCSDNHTLIPRGLLSKQGASSVLQLHRQVLSFSSPSLTLCFTYFGTWVPADTWKEVSSARKKDLWPQTSWKEETSQKDPQVPPLDCHQLWPEQKSISRAFCEIHTATTSKTPRTC